MAGEKAFQRMMITWQLPGRAIYGQYPEAFPLLEISMFIELLNNQLVDGLKYFRTKVSSCLSKSTFCKRTTAQLIEKVIKAYL